MTKTPPSRASGGASRPTRATRSALPGDRRHGRIRVRRRLVSVLVVQLLLFVAVGAKLVDLQVLRPDDYRQLSHDQRVREEVLAADRGTIFDRHGAELALSVPQRSIFVDPALVVDPVAGSRALAEVLGDDPERIERLMRAENRFGYVARQVPDEAADAVESLSVPGVALITEPRRFLPNGDLAASIVGLTDIDGVGMSGLEEQYGEMMTGTPGRLVLEQARDGRTIPVGEHHLVPPRRGHDLVLTIDRALQFEAEQFLAEQVAEANAAGGVAIVTRPETGEILAMANVTRSPTSGEVIVDVNNAALTTAYEPGSVMKLVSVAAAMEDGHVTPDTVLTVPDHLTLGGYTIDEHTPHGIVSWPVSEIVAQSSNTGSILLAQQVGRQRLHDHLRSFGFGEQTAIGFPNEQAGDVPAVEEWWDSSMGTIPIGYGVSVTPLQMLLAYNVVANGGEYVPPRLVLETIDPEGAQRLAPVDPARRLLSEDTADRVNLVLRGVVGAGTGQRAAVEGYTVAGKTGTALKSQPNGGYTDEYGVTRYQATFVGFVPAEAPAVSIIVVIDDPRAGVIYGGQLAAPVFAQLARSALRRLDVPPPATDRSERFAAEVSSSETLAVEMSTDTTVRVRDSILGPTPQGRVRALAAGEEPPWDGSSGDDPAAQAVADPSATGAEPPAVDWSE